MTRLLAATALAVVAVALWRLRRAAREWEAWEADDPLMVGWDPAAGEDSAALVFTRGGKLVNVATLRQRGVL